MVYRKMFIFVNKHLDVLVLVCLIKLFIHNKLSVHFMADVIAIFMLADVVPYVLADVTASKICLFCGRWKATVVDVATT